MRRSHNRPPASMPILPRQLVGPSAHPPGRQLSGPSAHPPAHPSANRRSDGRRPPRTCPPAGRSVARLQRVRLSIRSHTCTIGNILTGWSPARHPIRSPACTPSCSPSLQSACPPTRTLSRPQSSSRDTRAQPAHLQTVLACCTLDVRAT